MNSWLYITKLNMLWKYFDSCEKIRIIWYTTNANVTKPQTETIYHINANIFSCDTQSNTLQTESVSRLFRNSQYKWSCFTNSCIKSTIITVWLAARKAATEPTAVRPVQFTTSQRSLLDLMFINPQLRIAIRTTRCFLSAVFIDIS